MFDVCRWALTIAVVGSLTAELRAEVFHLGNGGDVRGEILNPTESPRTHYVIKTAQGGKISLPADQVTQVDKQSAKEIEYDRLAAAAADSVKGQWDLAEYCRENHLHSQRTKHLERIIQLEPDHAEARRALGYSRVKGKWTTVEEGMNAQGRKFYKNAWRLPQEIELMERARHDELAQKDWFAKLKRWRGWYTGGKQEMARVNIGDITDPLAVKGLSYFLEHEEDRDLKLLWIGALTRIGGGGFEPLVTASLSDGDEEIRIACWERLAEAKYRPAVLRYISLLKHKDNDMVNLAAVGLNYMQDPSAIPALIDALITIHKYTIPASGQPGQMTTTFGNGPGGAGGGNFSFGQAPPQEIKREIQNADVLRALVSLAGTNFDYNVSAWKHWYASQKSPTVIDARRDER
ncbi:MAG TPA: hypothetical protein VMF30_01370 [Pirellulales bacterium]|nr:hypothetical protein [Pirellulales bacterium]